MKNFKLKPKEMLKLTILVLLAFSLYPSTEGKNIEGNKSLADSLNILEELETYERCNSKSRIEKTIERCFADAEAAYPELKTVEECKKAYEPGVGCLANDLDACGVHPRLRATFIIQINRFVSTRACLPLAKND